MTRQAVALIAVLALVSFACAQQAAPSKTAHAACGTPTVLGDGWPIAKPEDAGLDGARLCGIAARLQAKPWTNGKVAAAGGLRLRPRDAAKIGQLILNNGRWNGRQIVSPEWIADSIKPRFQAIGYFGGLFFYGYTWWMGRTLAADKEVTWIAGVGLGGQRLFVIPELDLVVTVTAGLYSSPRQGNAPLDILYRFVIPAVRHKASDR